MAKHGYYEAEMASGGKIYDSDLCTAINEFGARKRQHYDARYDSASEAWTEVVVDSWAKGPLLYLEEFDSDGETRDPTLGNGLVTVIVNEGYVPWGFRPETETQVSGGRTQTGRWMWYLRPVEDVVEGEFYDIEYALKRIDDGQYLRGDDDYLLTFDNEGDAKAVMMAALEEYEVVEVPQ